MITKKQKNNIHKLSVDDALTVLYECIEHLGVVSQKEFVKATNYQHSRQNLALDMKRGKIKHVKIGGVRFPIINNFDN